MLVCLPASKPVTRLDAVDLSDACAYRRYYIAGRAGRFAAVGAGGTDGEGSCVWVMDWDGVQRRGFVKRLHHHRSYRSV